MSRQPISRALLSVFDKTGIADLARTLHEGGVEILSTGSTATVIADAGVPVTPVEDVTGFPECLDGRVKTLHPAVHAGILADRAKSEHARQLDSLGVTPIDLVVVNLYPFAETVASGASDAECIEKIDIGGPTMVRAAAKNHSGVAVLVDPARYPEVAEALAHGGFTAEQRRELALEAFRHTASYDVAVATWLATRGEQTPALPSWIGTAAYKSTDLRYGENPHQRAALYATGGGLAEATQLGGKAMSYNNYVDADAAWRAAWDQGEAPTCAVVKHTNPCGLAVGETIAEAHEKAHACDPVSAFGGIIAVNREVDARLAAQIRPIFTEVVLAPSFSSAALDILTAKKNLRLLQVAPPRREGLEIRPISGGLLAQEVDTISAAGTTQDGTDYGDDVTRWRLVAGEAANPKTVADLAFAWRAVRSVKSNAVLLAKDRATVGVGMGQVNRVDSARLAVERANTLGVTVHSDTQSAGGAEGTSGADAPERARGAVAASDAFFPFADGLQVLIDAGVSAVVAPGGSVRDDEVIAAAEAAGITLYFTGVRHFFH
ncbi:MAG: bifunctional phosphoribosylaminoimidazolecarboxamide formyltransferase/IMP cyclohydrolase [Bowdeniella nasicola]|nr:bifunctional phosphoribosylaminoimidazolecarboxamide formyltransferase/IMP cyclohydrolase [Bowdeniella nasicola]